LKGLDDKAVLAWMDSYCQANSLETIAKAGEVFVGAHRLVPASQEHAQAAPNFDACQGQITDAYRQIDSNHPQAPATIAALEDMHCKGSPDACSLGANHRRNQINADQLEKSEKTRMVLQTIGCFRSWRERSAK
jgi:hypothetical protein